jgi:hypothetical protein
VLTSPRCAGQRELTIAKASWYARLPQSDGTFRPQEGPPVLHTTFREADRTFICRSCQGLARLVRMAEAIVKEGKAPEAALDELDAAGLNVRRLRSPSQVREFFRIIAPHLPRGQLDPYAGAAASARKRATRLDQAERGVRSQSDDERRARRITASKWARGVNIEVRQCAGCGLLLLYDSTVATRPELHQQCMIEFMRSEEGRRWLSDRRKAREEGQSLTTINREHGFRFPIPPRRLRDPNVLKRDFTWAVRSLLGEESHALLAEEAGVSRPNVTQAIRRILALLPDPERVQTRFRHLIERLHDAARDQERTRVHD